MAPPDFSVECSKYDNWDPDSKACSHFLKSGACELPSEFMCVVWTNRFEAVVTRDLVTLCKKKVPR